MNRSRTGTRSGTLIAGMMMSGRPHRFAICAALLMAACSERPTEDPAVVFERAALTAQQLQSAVFDATISYDAGTGMSVNGTINGLLADGGKQLSMTVDGDMIVPSDGLDQAVSVHGEIIVAGEGETYMKIARLDGSLPFLPGVGLVSDDMIDRWFRIGGGSSSGVVAITPDPSFLELQTQSLTVVQDRSFEQVDEHRCYAYDVTLDPAKTVAFLENVAAERNQPFDRAAAEAFVAAYAAKGTIWIDAETSVIRRITWSFEGTEEPRAMLTFSLHLTEHNQPVMIVPPSDTVPLPAL